MQTLKYPGATLSPGGVEDERLGVTATTATMVRRHKTWVTTNTNFRLYNGHNHTLSCSCLLPTNKKRRAGVSWNPTNKTGCPCCRSHKSFVIYLRHLASSKAICHLIINFYLLFSPNVIFHHKSPEQNFILGAAGVRTCSDDFCYPEET